MSGFKIRDADTQLITAARNELNGTEMEIFDNLPESQKDKVYFIHLNHTNPARFSTSTAYKDIIERGYKIANSNDRFCLD